VTVRLRAVAVTDAPAIAAIYAPFVELKPVSFEEAAPSAEAMAERIASATQLYPWIVALSQDDAVMGYASAGRFRERWAFRFTVETGIYIAPAVHGQGIGRRLYQALLDTLRAQGFHQAMATITLPNGPSVALHERMGFEPAGVWRNVGYKNDTWRDVGLWQRPLQQPSPSPAEPIPFPQVGIVDRRG